MVFRQITVGFTNIKKKCLFILTSISLIAAEYNVLIYMDILADARSRQVPHSDVSDVVGTSKSRRRDQMDLCQGGIRTRDLSHHRPRHCLCAIASAIEYIVKF